MHLSADLAKRSIVLVLLVTFTGCAIGRTDFTQLNPDGKDYAPKTQEYPIYLTTMGVDQEYEEIGFVHVSATTREGYDALNEKLRVEARRHGGDAVIYVTYGLENAFSIVPFVVAIPYDVLVAEGLVVRVKQR